MQVGRIGARGRGGGTAKDAVEGAGHCGRKRNSNEGAPHGITSCGAPDRRMLAAVSEGVVTRAVGHERGAVTTGAATGAQRKARVSHS